jgi:mannitol 2-dehydrogenase
MKNKSRLPSKMDKSVSLNNRNLRLLNPVIQKPEYDRKRLVTGIVHAGVGGFHRSHQAYYTDQLCQKGITDWSICGIGLMKNDRVMLKNLGDQDHLYTLVVNHPDGNVTAQVIGSITEYFYVPDNPVAAIQKMAQPETRIVSLTITEGGYNYNQSTGDFINDNPDIQWDLKNPLSPRTIFGLLVESLKIRKGKKLEPFTILSCDNIQHNGDVAKKMLLAFAELKNNELRNWIERSVSFPNCMVDRITPVPTEETKQMLAERFGIDDKCPVACEPFCQWIIEDRFVAGRPEWENAGAQFVSDVSPFEKMKIRLLNAGHSLLGFTGALHGYDYIHECARDKLFAQLLRNFMDKEVTPVLDPVPGIDLASYKNTLLERFGNASIKDTVSRICGQSSAKIPKFLLPTVHDQLKAAGPVKISAFVVAAWCCYSRGIDEKGRKYDLDDELRIDLNKAALASDKDELSFLRIEPVFGDIIKSATFTGAYSKALHNIRDLGISEATKLALSL